VIGHAASEDERREADQLLGFLTPIVKACLTEWSVECTYHALQCFGGHGYIREWGMEQLARDARITTIYEGTTGIQALDLIGRKVIQQQGPGLQAFLGMLGAFCAQESGNDALAEFVGPLAQAARDWQQLTMDIGRRAMEDPEEIGAASVDYLFYSGYVALAYWWARAVATADAGGDAAVARAKRETARFYFQRILPRTLAHAAAIHAGAGSLMNLADDEFDI
jgi:hypothetical protein